MFEALDGPSIQGVISVGTGVAVEAKVGGSVFTDRKVITVQPDNKIYVFFADDNSTPSTTDVSTKGFIHFKDAKETYEAGPRQKVYLLSALGTVNVRLAERA